MEKQREFILNGIEDEIKDILYGYVKEESFTYSKGEKRAEAFFLKYFEKQEYWKEHPEYLGASLIAGDPFNRASAFAMVRGEGAETVVFIHHNDVVTIADFKLMKPLAFSPDELEKELHRLRGSISQEAATDLEEGTYLYGRGVCDMKGGASIQMALLSRYGELQYMQEKKNVFQKVRKRISESEKNFVGTEGNKGFKGNIIVLAVPDEENLSAGMAQGILLLAELKEKYGLDYKIMVNSEPHQRKDPEKGVFSLGSVGKMMPFIYVRGSLAHAGKVFEGFNPVNLLSGIVRKTELNMELSESVKGEAAPPPTWLFCRDRKTNYDVSMPLSVMGCFSVLTLTQTPAILLSKVRRICEEAFGEIVEEMNLSYVQFLRATGHEEKRLPWKVRVTDFAQLYNEAKDVYGKEFLDAYEREILMLSEEVNKGEASLPDCNFQLIDFVYNYIDDLTPRIVYGLIPPYYPGVSNLFFENLPDEIRDIGEILGNFTKERFKQEYVTEYFYTGISDLSYSSISNSEEITEALQSSMPFFGRLYSIPVKEIEKISMPCINIGPWGKDFHKLTERVLKEDLYKRTPEIIQYAIERILE